MSRYHKNSLSMRILVAYKIVYGLFLGVTGLGIIHFINKDWSFEVSRFISTLHLDQENHIMKMLLGVAGLNHHQLEAIGAGSFFYALIEMIEGLGLRGGYNWAKYLTVISTGIFLLPEGYEITRKLSLVRCALFILNVIVVIYLIWQLRKEPDQGKVGYPSSNIQ